MMTLNDYQIRATETNEGTTIYTGVPGQKLREVYGMYNAIGLAGEAGELCEKIKKHARDNKWDPEGAMKEMGDVLWYLSQLARDYGFSLEEVAVANLEKLASRKERGVLSGSGDNR
jgi:NTP pyrophosphatase (non-canonical NTP hydrolase)